MIQLMCAGGEDPAEVQVKRTEVPANDQMGPLIRTLSGNTVEVQS